MNTVNIKTQFHRINTYIYQFIEYIFTGFLNIIPLDFFRTSQHSVSMEELWVGPSEKYIKNYLYLSSHISHIDPFESNVVMRLLQTHFGRGRRGRHKIRFIQFVLIPLPWIRTRTWLRFGGHDQERGHTSVNRSCVLALRSVTYLDVRSDQTTTANIIRFSSGPRWRT